MMRNLKINKLVLLLLILALSFAFTACDKPNDSELPAPTPEPLEFIISGDVEGSAITLNLLDYTLNPYSYEKDGETVTGEGYLLSDILGGATLLKSEAWLLLAAPDGVAARIDINDAELCYLTITDEGYKIIAPSHPPVAGIRGLFEITVIVKDDSDIEDGIKLVNPDGFEIISRGTARLALYEQTAENYKFGIVAYKHQLLENSKLSALTSDTLNLVYLDNCDIVKSNSDSGELIWQDGKLSYQIEDETFFGIVGTVSGTEVLIYDAFNEMKAALDRGEKVMFILPDGFSFEQVGEYGSELTVLSDDYVLAASVNPAISPVALAAIVTGVSPYHTEIIVRGVKRPAAGDIFDYAVSQGKTVSYIEGNGNLIVTTVPQLYNVPDVDGYTDGHVFDTAMSELESNPDLIFIHFHGIDDSNHDNSPISDESERKILEIDEYISDLTEGFVGTIIIVPDHGAVTRTDSEENIYGTHGVFEDKDMYVPYYVIHQE